MTMQRAFPWFDRGEPMPNAEFPANEIKPGQVVFVPKGQDLDSYIQRMVQHQDNLKKAQMKDAVNKMDEAVQHGDYNAPGRGVKNDAGKQKFHLIPFDLMGGEQAVWEYGAKKYAPNQWRKGMPMTQPLNAAMRHLTAFMSGEDLDPETGLSHLDHLICCIRMAQNTMKNFPELDDRAK